MSLGQIKLISESIRAKTCFCFARFPLEVKGFLLLLLVIAVLHTLDRQGEYVARTDFLWKAKLKVEQEEVETMRGINKVALTYNLQANCFIYQNRILSDSAGEHSAGSRGNPLSASGALHGAVSRKLLLCGRHVCLHTQLQGVL